MGREKIILLSDTHLGGGRDFDWLGVRGRRELTFFLTGLAGDDSLAELVLTGDILDCWVWPNLDKKPLSFAEILASDDNKGVVGALRTLTDIPEIKVTYIQGNHDMDAWKDLPAALKAAFPGIQYEATGIERGPLWVEHGSLHTIFNAPDPLHDSKNGLPLGYFITRVNESKSFRVRKNYTIGAIVHAALQAYLIKQIGIFGWVVEPARLRTLASDQIERMQENFITHKLAAWVFEFVVAKAGQTLDATITMQDGSSETLRSVRDRYADLYADKERELGKKGAWDALIAEIDRMEPVAEAEARRRNKKAVLFGHSHKHHVIVEDVVYLNDGCFLRDTRVVSYKTPHFFVATPVGTGFRITLWRWNKDKSVERDSEITI